LIEKKYNNLPKFPGKNLFGNLKEEKILKRKKELEIYLQELILNTEVMVKKKIKKRLTLIY
jgi:hypothetical protein